MADSTLHASEAQRLLDQHRRAAAQMHDILRWVELCPPSPAESPSGQGDLARWRDGLVSRLDVMESDFRSHVEEEERSEMFDEHHPAFRRFGAQLVHLRAEHPIMLAALGRLRAEAAPKLAAVLIADTKAFLATFETHERIENEIIAAVYGETLEATA